MTNEEIDDAWDAQLKGRKRLFVLHFCTNEQTFLNASASYREAYTKKDKETGKYIQPEQSTCETNGSKLMKREEVKIAIRRLLVLAQGEKDDLKTYQLLNELALLASYNPADILDKAGRLTVKNLSDLGEKAKCIAQITPTIYGVKYTLYDRNKALDKLVNYLNIVRPEQQIDITMPVMEIVRKAVSAEAWNAQSEGDQNGRI